MLMRIISVGSQQSQEIRTVYHLSFADKETGSGKESQDSVELAHMLLHEWSWSPFGARAGSVTNTLHAGPLDCLQRKAPCGWRKLVPALQQGHTEPETCLPSLARGRTRSRSPGEPRLLTACPALKALGKGRIRGSARSSWGAVPSPTSPPSRRLLRRHVLYTVGSLKGLGEAFSKSPVLQMVTRVPKVWVEQSSQARHRH